MEMGLASEPRGCTMCHLRVESLTFAYYYFAGRLGAHIHGDFHDRDVLQHPGERIHSTQKQLHEESLEYHGLHCCRFRVSDYFDAMITVCKFKNIPTNYEYQKLQYWQAWRLCKSIFANLGVEVLGKKFLCRFQRLYLLVIQSLLDNKEFRKITEI